MVDYLEEGRTINNAYQVAASGDCEKEKRKVDSRCSALSG